MGMVWKQNYFCFSLIAKGPNQLKVKFLFTVTSVTCNGDGTETALFCYSLIAKGSNQLRVNFLLQLLV